MSDVVVRVRGGDGLVVRHGDVVAVAHGTDADLAVVVDGLRRLDASGGTAADLLGVVRSLSDDAAVAVAVIGADTDVVILGAVRCDTTAMGDQREAFTGSSTAQLLGLPSEVEEVALALTDAVAAADQRTALVAGVVPGGGVEVFLVDSPPTLAAPVIAEPSAAVLPPPVVADAPAPPDPAPDPHRDLAPPAASEFVNLLLEPMPPDEMPDRLPEAPEEESTPNDAVTVRGLACSLGHVNRLDASYCSSCGRRLQGTVNLSEGPRPSLGTIIFDDGTTFGVDTGYVIGRDPGADAAVSAGRSHALPLPDPDRSISRVHAEIRLDGWDTVIVDRGSANGTHVYPFGGTAWTRLQPDVPVVLGDGWSVAVGRRTFVFQQR